MSEFRKELENFIKIFNHEYNGKEWGIDQFMKGWDNWIKPSNSGTAVVGQESPANDDLLADIGKLIGLHREIDRSATERQISFNVGIIRGLEMVLDIIPQKNWQDDLENSGSK